MSNINNRITSTLNQIVFFDANTGLVTGLNTANLTNSQLGPVGNLHIAGGSNTQVLTTDGTGNLSWANSVAGGSNAVQFNSNGVVDGSNNFTYNSSNIALQVGNLGFQSWVSGNLNYNIIHSNGNPSGFRMNSNRMGIGILDANGAFASNTVGVQIIAAENATVDPTVTFAAFGPSGTSNYTVRIRSTDNSGGTGNVRISGNLQTDDHAFFNDVSNLHIGNGSAGQVLRTEGSGNISWTGGYISARAAVASISNAVDTVIQWTSIDTNTTGLTYDNGLWRNNTGRALTVYVSYVITYNTVVLNAPYVGYVVVNGNQTTGTNRFTESIIHGVTAAAQPVVPNGSTILQLAAGDYFAVYTWQSSGGAATIGGAGGGMSAGYSTRLQVSVL